MSTIPANLLVTVNPSVLAAAGSALDLTGLILSTSTRVPIGTVASFPDGPSVAAFFGSGSAEDIVANGGAGLGSGYFGGFTNSDKLPGAILFAQYNQNAVAAYLRGGQVSSLTLAQLQALSGSLTITADGYAHVISSISFAATASFSTAAAALTAAFTNPTQATFTAAIGATFTGTGAGTNLTTTATTGLISIGDTVTGTGVPAGTTIVSQTSGTLGGNGVYVTSQATTASSAACVASSNVLNVTAVASGTLAVGLTLTGAGVPAGVLITSQTSGAAGGIGIYRFSGTPLQIASQSDTGVATAVTVTYDSVSGSFLVTSGVTGVASTMAFATGTLAASLKLTSATGAVLSQGAAAAVPAAFMNSIVAVTTAWATFMTAFDPDGGSGNTVKQAFAAWKNSQNDRYAYICADTDVTPTLSVPAVASLGQILDANGDSGTCLIYQPTDFNLPAFICGAIASIDFEETAGRTTMAYRSQAGLLGSVTDATIAVNLGGNPQGATYGNHYNYYGAFGAANANFIWFQRGTCTGPFKWIDSYVNQIWLNNAFQSALLVLLQNRKSIPYNNAGAGLIEAALADPIAAGLNFGAYASGTISSLQAAEVNADAGASIANTLQTQGWYLQVLPASDTVRANRGSPPCKFWYLDRGSVQAITLASVALQ